MAPHTTPLFPPLLTSVAQTEQPNRPRPHDGVPIRVLVPRALPIQLDYLWPTEPAPDIGQFVELTLSGKPCHGVVTACLPTSAYQNLKPVHAVADSLRLQPQTLAFYRWCARYTLAPPGEPLRAGLIKGQIPPRPTPEVRYGPGLGQPTRWTPQRSAALAAAEQQPNTLRNIAAAAGVAPSVVQGLARCGALVPIPTHYQTILPQLAPLNPEQQAAYQALAAHHRQGFQVFVLDGVTGSGKTEVYFHAIATFLQHNSHAQCLILLPEIALTPQWLARFQDQFGLTPHVWHHQLTAKQRATTWWAVQDGTAQVVVGARSALFLPWQNLSLITVDEEHDPSYTQTEGWRYPGRNLAISLAQHWDCPIILASATPSLETYQHASTGKYRHLRLTQRHGASRLPDVQLLDLREHPPALEQFLSPFSLQQLQTALANHTQALVYLNRRGTAPVLICTSCGTQRGCSRCSATLTVHAQRLICHYCGYQEDWPDMCASCQSEHTRDAPIWRPYGPGTRRIYQEIQSQLPTARLLVLDSDSMPSLHSLHTAMAAIHARTVDIVIGTQMLAKGHDWPHLSTVIVVDGDMGLSVGDVRATERTFQLLQQVAGRAGRREHPGRVLIQTHQPEADIFQALQTHNRDHFYALELHQRQTWGDPPFGRHILIQLSSKQESVLQRAGALLARTQPTGVTILGPAPAPLYQLRDQYRLRFLVKSAHSMQGIVKDWLETTSLPHTVQVHIAVDP